MIKDIDNNEYNIVEIGSQKWSSKNLMTTRFRNGDSIKNISSIKEWEQAGKNGTPAWCFYNNNPENGKLFGLIYNWHAVIDPRGLAPLNTHLPSIEEWRELKKFCSPNEGEKLKSKDTWEVISCPNHPNRGKVAVGIDKFEFCALPGGYRDDTINKMNDKGEFFGLYETAHFWSSSKWDNKLNSFNPHGMGFGLNSGNTASNTFHGEVGMGGSVRFIKDTIC